jgi:hypothetical protein
MWGERKGTKEGERRAGKETRTLSARRGGWMAYPRARKDREATRMRGDKNSELISLFLAGPPTAARELRLR